MTAGGVRKKEWCKGCLVLYLSATFQCLPKNGSEPAICRGKLRVGNLDGFVVTALEGERCLSQNIRVIQVNHFHMQNEAVGRTRGEFAGYQQVGFDEFPNM